MIRSLVVLLALAACGTVDAPVPTVVYAINATTGMLTLIDHTSTQGATPRNFAIDPDGAFLYAANAGSNSVVPFRIDPTAGTLTSTATAITVPAPQFVGVFALPL